MQDLPPRSAPVPHKPSLPPRPAVGMQRRGELRVQKFLDAATAVFNEKGYQHARLSDIVQRAGGSLATLYRAFGDKEGLVHALMEKTIHDFGQGMEELLASPLPPQQALEQAACRMVEEVLTPARIACHRIVVSEGHNQPGLRDWFHAHGVAPMESQLAQYFARQSAAGVLHIENSEHAAHAFYMLTVGGLILRSVNRPIDANDIQQAKQNACRATRLFLAGSLPRT